MPTEVPTIETLGVSMRAEVLTMSTLMRRLMQRVKERVTGGSSGENDTNREDKKEVGIKILFGKKIG